MADPSRVCRRHFSSGEGPDRCLLCELEVQYGLTRFDCDDCDGNFGSEHALMQHRNSAAHDAHRCGSCNRVFGSAAALQQHVDSGIHRPSRFECVVCNRSFGSVQALNQHRSSASHLSYQCEECSRSFSTTEGLAQHWNSRHQNRRCENCEVTFDRIHDLIWHTCVYRPETWDDEDEEYRCHDCDSVFSSLLSLQMHQDGEEPPEETDPLRFECSLCDREFGSQHSLDQHTADSPVHRRRQFRCLECNLGFLSGDALEEHRNDAWLHPRDYSPPRSPIRGSGRVLPDMDLLTLRAGAVSLAVPTQSSFSQPFNVADMSDFSDEESFYNYQTYGYPTNFGTTTSPSTDATAESAGSTGQAGSTSNQGVNPSRNLDPSTVTKPATEDPKTDPVVLDSEPAPSESSDPEQQLKAEREKVAILTRDLLAAREALKKEKLHRQCGMCYEKPTDTVTKCGHLFCGGCIANWQRQHDHPFQAPCPMCRKAMGRTIKIYTD
ncbi:Zinc finger, double-stranded RNA binding protein [Ilyonectria robusta]